MTTVSIRGRLWAIELARLIEREMDSSRQRRVLVLANRPAATLDILATVTRYAREQPTTFSLLIPEAPMHDQTDWTLGRMLPLLERAAGAPVTGLTGVGGDAWEAIENVVWNGNYDRIIISTLDRRGSKWLRRDLPKRVAALGVPVEVVEVARLAPAVTGRRSPGGRDGEGGSSLEL